MNADTAIFPTRETIAAKLSDLNETNEAMIKGLFEKTEQDDLFLEGLHAFLDQQANAPFLNSLKLTKTGEWLGDAAPDRLQIRIMEAAKSSQHGAYAAFREGLTKSGGLERAFPTSPL